MARSHLSHAEMQSRRLQLCLPPSPMRLRHVLHLEPVLTIPLGAEPSYHPHERRECCDVNKAGCFPVSNTEGRPMRARTVGVLTSDFVLDRPAHANHGRGTVLKPLSELRRPMVVSDYLGGYYSVPGRDDGEAEDIESCSAQEYESERRNRAKRRRCV